MRRTEFAPEPWRPHPAAGEPAKDALEVGRNRLLAIAGVFALAFLVLAGRLVEVATLHRGGAVHASAGGAGEAPTERADILDRNGIILATSLRTASLYANPRRLIDPAAAAAAIATVLPDLGHGTLLKKLSAERSFVWLKRNLTPKQHYAVNRLGIPGIGFVTERHRVYPQGALTAHAVGFAGIDNRGLAGIERSFDEVLAPAAPGRGGPIRLSLDVRVQSALHDELSAAVAEFMALGAAGVVLDARTGEILALVSLPDFDPNHPAAASADALFNRASLGVYEMGSTFKTFTMAMALDLGTVDLGGGYDATEPLRVARFVIRDDHAKRRWLSVPEIFVYSSNIGAAKMARDVGGPRQKEFLDQLGLLRRPAIEIPEVGRPMWPEPWREINTMTIAFGHGIAVSALQLASGVAAIVNEGVMAPVTLLRREEGQPVAARRVIAAETSAIMRRLLRLVVTSGTGRKAEAPGYAVGGKTGTARKIGESGYRRGALISSFVGVFPIEAPRYVVLALLDEPQGNESTMGFASGGWTAAPLVGRVVARIAPILGVAPVDEEFEPGREAMLIRASGGGAQHASF